MPIRPLRGILPFVFFMGLSHSQLLAQVTYTSVPGKATISAIYDPNTPAPKAPVASSPIPAQPFLPAAPMDEYLAQKAAMAQYTQLSFSLPSAIETTPTPRAPGASTPIVSTPTASFAAQTDTGFPPGTPDVAAGPSDVLVVVNSNLAWYTKTGTLKKATAFDEWFSNVLGTVCPTTCLLFDPWIVYDQLHGHFLFLAGATPVNQQSRFYSYLLLSVSNGATYDSGWKNYALPANLDGPIQTTFWGDSWRLGYDNVAVYLSGNMYNTSGVLQYAKVRVIAKSDLYNPALLTLTYQDIGSATAKLRNANGTIADSLMPIRLRGRPGSGSAGYFVNSTNYGLPANYVTVWKINDPLARPVSMTQTNVGGLLTYNVPAAAPQLNSPGTLDSGDARTLKAVYRNGFLYTARDTGYSDAATSVTYDIIDTSTTTISSQARLMNANVFYPAFDVPATTAPGTQFATASAIAGTTTAANGTLTYPGVTRLKAGEDAYSINFGGTSRWGDYFGATVDPISGGLWVSGAYARPSLAGGFGQWGIWAGYFPWLSTASFNDVPSTSSFYDYINVLSSWQITSGCSSSPPLFCPTNLVTREQLATLIIRAMLGDTFPYTATPYFTDVPATSTFFKYIQKMADLGIVHGCTPTTFCPGGFVPRGDAAVMIVRGKLDALFNGDGFNWPPNPFFTDVPASLAQFRYIQKMFELGITTGCSSTQFCPDSLLTRQEIAVFLTRAFLN